MIKVKTFLIAGLVGATALLSACSGESVVDNTVGATGYVAKTAIKGTVGAGKLAVKGVKKISGTDD